MENKSIVDIIVYNSDWILRHVKTQDNRVWERLYPILQFVERSKDVCEGLLMLSDGQGEFHKSWMLLLRPLMYDGVLSSYLLYFSKNNDILPLTYDMLGDQLNRIQSHAKRQRDWNFITPDEYNQIIETFQGKFPIFYDGNGKLKFKKKLDSLDVLVSEIKSNAMIFSIAENFYTKYIILSKYEHYNILNKEFPNSLKVSSYIQMVFVHLFTLCNLIVSIESNLLPEMFIEQLERTGKEVEPKFFVETH